MNRDFDAVSILDTAGIELFGWHRLPDQEEGEVRAGADFSEIEDVRLVLAGYDDGLGVKRTFVAQTVAGPMIFTLGPIYHNADIVGAALVGRKADKLVSQLTEDAIARVTLYDRGGEVVATMFTGDGSETKVTLQESSDLYQTILARLGSSVEPYRVIATQADSQVPIRQVEIREQTYQLAFGEWRMRRQSFGLFSVALPSNFIVTASATSRNLLSLVFSLVTIAVLSIGYLIAHRIVEPLNRLIHVSTAVAQGDLDQRTGIDRDDEIGDLAASFDIMTARLAAKKSATGAGSQPSGSDFAQHQRHRDRDRYLQSHYGRQPTRARFATNIAAPFRSGSKSG